MGWNPVRDLKKAFGKVKRESTKIFKDIEKALNKAKNAIEDAAEDCLDDVKKAGKRAQSQVKGVINAGIREIENAKDKVIDAGEDALDSVEKEGKKATKLISREIEALPDRIEDMAEDAMVTVADSVLDEALETGIAMASKVRDEMAKLREDRPDLVQAIDGLGFDLQLGPVTLKWVRFYDRSEDIIRSLTAFVDKPLEFRRSVLLDTISAIAPDSVQTGISAQLAAVVVSSKELSIGISLCNVKTILFLELGDLILEELGVPE